jgi:hypothetical protein
MRNDKEFVERRIPVTAPVGLENRRQCRCSEDSVGEIADRLGIRVTDCQLGCFKVDKTLYDNPEHKPRFFFSSIDKFVAMLEKMIAEKPKLTCTKVFELARQYRVKPTRYCA